LIDKEKKKMQVISSGSEILKLNKQYKLAALINSHDFLGEIDFLVAPPHLGAKKSQFLDLKVILG
jgi:hypothetical protein